ncbi:Two-component transcriptional response regulator, LuxR family [hydrothermal vent metagenome]|uniref:Two-component transcriptional response regulator, LuxR family n=1 Tax=hydrothermal vent metagenome TaxID=652676 RepID=A0A3B0YFK5_9ZZZZ
MTKLQRIMHVEDEPDIQLITKIALQDMGGFELLACNSGEQALAEVERFLPDLLLLDVMMPGLNGPDTLMAIRKISQFENIPALFMTAKVQPSELEELKALGALDVIPKPFNPVTLADDIRVIWNTHINI